MPDENNLNDALGIVYCIDYSVITDTNAPAILRSDKLAATRRAWISGQGADGL